MGFWTLFWPVSAAMFAALSLSEGVHILVAYIFHRRVLKKAAAEQEQADAANEAIQQRLASLGIDPARLQLQLLSMAKEAPDASLGAVPWLAMPIERKVEDQKDKDGTGQYL